MRTTSPITNTRAHLSRFAVSLLLLSIVASLSATAAPTTVRAAEASAAAPVGAPGAPASAWARTTREAGLWSGWDQGAVEFVKVPSDTMVQVIEARGSRVLVYVGGDRHGRKPGEAWIDRAALADAAWPRWIRARRDTSIRVEPGILAGVAMTLPQSTYLETTGDVQGRWAQVFYLGEGRLDMPLVGWVDGADFALPSGDQKQMTDFLLTRSKLDTQAPEVWLRVPYRSQLDGSAFAAANCGPSSVTMVLEAFGRTDTAARVRAAALIRQGDADCDDCGIFIENLAAVTEAHGLKTYGLYDSPSTLHAWSLAEIRAELRAGHVVIPQVMFRFLPGRADSPYWGDHFVVITGIDGNSFIFNDPIDSDGRGYGRLIAADMLMKAMSESDFPGAAFAIGR
ncbi:MAG: C39 family peptidase [Chloroflexi bacterium]|nr:C39 family peptidase [Chloroflexota bacterium]